MLPKATSEYEHGQMMGMLVIISLFESFADTGKGIKGEILEDVKRIAVKDLSEYLNKPEEDVYLLVEQELKDIK